MDPRVIEGLIGHCGPYGGVGLEQFGRMGTYVHGERFGGRRVGFGWEGLSPECKVSNAIKDGYTTYEELVLITGLTRREIDDAIKELARRNQLRVPEVIPVPRNTAGGTRVVTRPVTGSTKFASGCLRIKRGYVC